MSENIDFLKIIKSRINIVDLISKDVKLIRSGNNLKGLCPFHNEKTPSFVINIAKESFKCFGCGVSGDIFSYIMEKYKVDFKESLRMLANEAGIKLQQNKFSNEKYDKKTEEKRKYFEIMQLISEYYHNNLKKILNENDYRTKILKEKKIEINIIEKYFLGLSSDIDGLANFLEKKYIDLELLFNLGIFKKNQYGKPYDMFTNRLMFPIKDTFERVLGFGGRTLDNKGPKYINSWENSFFKKRSLLYNMNNLKNLKSRSQDLFMVEGYTDVISMEENGYSAVAPLGTAVSMDQINLSWKYVNHPIVLFDGDEAGYKATLRMLDLVLPEIEAEKSLNFIFLENQDDPDMILKRPNGKSSLDFYNKNKKSFIETLIASEVQNNLDTPENILIFKKKLLYKVNRIANKEVRSLYSYIIKEKIKETLMTSVKKTNYSYQSINKDNFFIKNNKNRKEEQFVLRRERSILGAMMNNFYLLKDLDETLAEIHISNTDLSTLRDNIIGLLSNEKINTSLELKELLINKGYSNLIKNHFATDDCLKFNLVENFADEKTDYDEAKKALMNVILMQEEWYKKKNKTLSKIS